MPLLSFGTLYDSRELISRTARLFAAGKKSERRGIGRLALKGRRRLRGSRLRTYYQAKGDVEGGEPSDLSAWGGCLPGDLRDVEWAQLEPLIYEASFISCSLALSAARRVSATLDRLKDGLQAPA
jgi:hypothetical protein